MNKPLVSVIVPIYNVSQYLRDCLTSIQGQSLTNFEVILINDGSTDESAAICNDFTKSDSRFKYFFQFNSGLVKAREAGISRAKGKYITFIDADDKVVTDFLRSLIFPLENNASDISVCNFYWWYSDSNPPVKEERAQVPHGQLNPIQFAQTILGVGKEKDYCVIGGYVWNKAFRTDQLKNIKLPAIAGAEDECFLFQLLPKVNRISYIDAPLYFYRQRQSSLVNRLSFSFFHALSRKMIVESSQEPFKKFAELGFIRSVIFLILNILQGKERVKTHLIETKNLANYANQLLQSEIIKTSLSPSDVRYSSVLLYRFIPNFFLFFFLRFRIYLLTSFLITQLKKFKKR